MTKKNKIENKMKTLTKILLIVIITFATISSEVFAQAPPPPPPGHGSTGNQTGGNAPIGGGLFILMALGAAYGGKKLYDRSKDNLEE